MDKTIIIPLSLMFILTVFSLYYSSSSTGSESEFSTGTNSSLSIGGINLGNWFSIDTPVLIISILIIAITIGILSGIKFEILGSTFQLSDEGQRKVTALTFYMAIWACLSVVSRDILFNSPISSVIWLCLTFIFIVGVGIRITSPVVSE